MPREAASATRQCLVSRETLPAEEMVRFVVAPDGSVVPDLRRELPGRGVWVTATRAAVAEAERKRLFARGFKQAVTVEPGLAERVDALMERGALQALSIARKAGTLVTGFTKVETAVNRGDVAALVTALDAAPDGVRKMRAVVLRRFGTVDTVPVIRIFASAQLDLALGSANVIHAALTAGRASDAVIDRVQRLARYRGLDVSDGFDGNATADLAAPQD